MPTFREWVTKTLAPVWLRGVWGAKYLGVIGEAADRVATAAKDAVKVRFVDISPVDALPYNGAARNIERYTVDTDTTYRTRLLDPWSLFDFSGSHTGVVSRLNDYGYPAVRVYGWYQLTPNVPPAWASWYSAFWIFIDPPHGITTDGDWDDTGTWGDIIPSTIPGGPDGVGAWDCNMTAAEIKELKAVVWKWKPGHEICAEISILVSGDRWENVVPWDNGTWSDDTAFIRIPGSR